MTWKSTSGFLFLLLLFFVTEAFCQFGLLDPQFYPAPSRCIHRLFELLFATAEENTPTLIDHIGASLFRLICGLSLAAIFTIPVALLSGLSEVGRRSVSALVGFVFPIPKSAIFPMFLLIFGIHGGAHIALIALGGGAAMLATSLAGLNRLEASGYLEVSRILKLSPATTVRRVLLPGLLPEFMHGFKLACSSGLVLMIVGEMMVTRLGIGVFLWSAWDQFKVIDLYATLYLVSILGLILYGAFDFLGEYFSDSQGAV